MVSGISDSMDEITRIALEGQNPWWFKKPFDTGIDRLPSFPLLRQYLSSKECLILIGARRTGKSTLVFQLVRHLLDTGTQKEAILYINLDEPLFASHAKDPAFLRGLIDDHCTRHEEISRFVVCIDEIQNFPHWAGTIKILSDTRPDIKLIVTGSTSSLLEREVSARLSGRYFSCPVYPLTFAEYLMFQAIENPTLVKKRHACDTYLTLGGYPRIVLEPEDALKKELLKNYYETIYLKDIIYPNKVRNNHDLYDVLYYLLSNTGTLLSYTRIAGSLGISAETVREYLDYAEEAFLLFTVKKFDFSVKKQMANPKKVYCIDTGIVSAVAFAFSENRGRLLENAVFMALQRGGGEIYYHKDRYECDFITRSNRKITQAIQVTESLADPDTKTREIRGLCEALEEYSLPEGTIVTRRDSGEEIVGEKKIHIRPVYDWFGELSTGNS